MPDFDSLAEIRDALDSSDAGRWYEAGRRMSRALDAVVKLHAPRADRVPGSSCGKHRLLVPTLLPLPDCRECVQDRRREVCPECRDEYGDPVLFDLCRVRSAVLAVLTGKEDDGD